MTPPKTGSGAALALRLSGASFADIAEVVGYQTPAAARTAVRSALERTPVDEGAREALRDETAARILRLVRAHWVPATDPADPNFASSARIVLTALGQYSRLYGLDAPQEVAVYTPTTFELDQWVAEMAGNGQKALPADAAIIFE